MEMNLLTLSVVKVVLKWVLAVVVDVCCLYRKYKKTKKYSTRKCRVVV